VVVRGALKWAVNDSLSITPSVYLQDLNLGDTSAYWPSLSDPGASNFENGNAQRNTSADPFYLAAIRVDWDAGGAQLTSNTSYFSRSQHSISDYTQFDRALFGLTLPPPPGDLGTSHDADTQHNFYQEFRLQSVDATARLAWTTGLFYAHLNENTTEHVLDPNLNGEYNAAYPEYAPFCNPQAPCPNGEILTQPISQIIDRQYALFGDATYRLTDAWKMTAGVRLSHIAYSGDLVYYGPFLSPAAGPATPLAATGSNSENPVTPKAVIAYQPDAQNLFYASASKGYRPGGLNGAQSFLCAPNLASIGLSAGPGLYAADSLCLRTEFRREPRQGAQRRRRGRGTDPPHRAAAARPVNRARRCKVHRDGLRGPERLRRYLAGQAGRDAGRSPARSAVDLPGFGRV
jgi:outer membrane receptor protein involved in Fe transport